MSFLESLWIGEHTGKEGINIQINWWNVIYIIHMNVATKVPMLFICIQSVSDQVRLTFVSCLARERGLWTNICQDVCQLIVDAAAAMNILRHQLADLLHNTNIENKHFAFIWCDKWLQSLIYTQVEIQVQLCRRMQELSYRHSLQLSGWRKAGAPNSRGINTGKLLSLQLCARFFPLNHLLWLSFSMPIFGSITIVIS